MSDSLPRWETEDRRTVATNALAKYVLTPGLDNLHQVADQLAERWDLEPREVQVWLAQLLVEGAWVLMQTSAGEAEAAGVPIGTIAAALGQGTTSNGRRKVPWAKKVAEARRAADMTGTEVTLDIGTWRWTLMPTTPPAEDPGWELPKT